MAAERMKDPAGPTGRVRALRPAESVLGPFAICTNTGYPCGEGETLRGETMTKAAKIEALIDGGLADDAEEAVAVLIDMGELDEDGEL